LDGWCAVGYCHYRRSVLTFGMQRIKSVRETGEIFDRPADFRLDGERDRTLNFLVANQAVESTASHVEARLYASKPTPRRLPGFIRISQEFGGFIAVSLPWQRIMP